MPCWGTHARAAHFFTPPMSEHPQSSGAPSSAAADEPGSGLWAPGERLLRSWSPGVAAVLLLVLSLLPLLSWLAASPRLAALHQAWLPLLAVALYGWVCAARVWWLRDTAQAAAAPALAAQAGQTPGHAEAAPPAALAHAASSLAPAVTDGAPLPAKAGSPAPETSPGGETPGEPVGAAANASPLLDPADLRVGHAEIRGATDEISRRVIGASGLIDACGKAADQALSDIEAMQDEDRHAQKLLSALRGRLLLLDQRCHALAELAQRPDTRDAGAQELHKRLQAVAAQILHCHQLAERLGVVERSHGLRVDTLRQGLGRVGGYAEGGLREAQQVMALTRRVMSTLDAADQDLARATGAPEGPAS
jgi:hypothetical protein